MGQIVKLEDSTLAFCLNFSCLSKVGENHQTHFEFTFSSIAAKVLVGDSFEGRFKIIFRPLLE